jgi:hypothetical protein
MGMKKIVDFSIVIIDDEIPKTEEFVRRGIYETELNANDLKSLIGEPWTGQLPLKGIIQKLLKSSIGRKSNISAFTHPSLFIESVTPRRKPNIIIYDWVYGIEEARMSKNWLLKILQTTEAFIFVYSADKPHIPSFLNQNEFASYSNRFQLFLKGEAESSIFSSEEFILQYIAYLVGNVESLSVGGVEVSLDLNGYLKKPSDILFLEGLLGRAHLLDVLKDRRSLDNKIIEDMINNVGGQVYRHTLKRLLISSDEAAMIERFQPTELLSYIEVLQSYGLDKLEEISQRGFAGF